MKKEKIITSIIVAIAVVAVFTAANAAFAKIIVIANEDVSVSYLSASELKNVYLGKKSFWDSDVKIVLAVLVNGSIHQSFLKENVGKTPEQFKNYWNKILYTGAGIPPTPLKTEAEMIEYIKKTRGAIGYVDSATPHEGVKVIEIR